MDWLLPRALAVANDEVWPLEGQLEELAELTPRFTGDLVVIHGTHDDLVPYGNADWAIEHFNNARTRCLLKLQGSGHFILWTHRPQIEAALAELR